ncbi:MAG: hypothetical protein IJ234_02160 [Clostridia bacterium]|nr:hypothetical protein [Clostridia bacterium]
MKTDCYCTSACRYAYGWTELYDLAFIRTQGCDMATSRQHERYLCPIITDSMTGFDYAKLCAD